GPARARIAVPGGRLPDSIPPARRPCRRGAGRARPPLADEPLVAGERRRPSASVALAGGSRGSVVPLRPANAGALLPVWKCRNGDTQPGAGRAPVARRARARGTRGRRLCPWLSD